MQTVPTVSVVLPVRNAEKYLRYAIDSILQQTQTVFELIIVDDGSTDASAEIAGRYARLDTRVSVVSLPPLGLAHALNAGIAAARGAYIARMDGDDIAHPNRLQKQVAFLDANPSCVLVGSAVDVIDADGASLGCRYFVEDHAEIVEELLGGTFAISHPTVLMRRAAVEEAGGYDQALYPSEDLALWLAMSNLGELANLREPLLEYRRHDRCVSVVNRASNHALTLRITNAARVSRGLAPLRGRAPSSPASIQARYHFDCARFALTGGRRLTALRHLAVTLKHAPSWWEVYAAVVACFLPRTFLFAALAVRARLRTSGAVAPGVRVAGGAAQSSAER